MTVYVDLDVEDLPPTNATGVSVVVVTTRAASQGHKTAPAYRMYIA